MSVYVDDMKAPYRGMIMCHMTASTPEELDAMADKIGVNRKWIQESGSGIIHYDICQTKRKAAIDAGAMSVTARAVVIQELYFKGDGS